MWIDCWTFSVCRCLYWHLREESLWRSYLESQNQVFVMEKNFLNSKIKKFQKISKWISNLEFSIFRALTEQVLVDDVEADEEASHLAHWSFSQPCHHWHCLFFPWSSLFSVMNYFLLYSELHATGDCGRRPRRQQHKSGAKARHLAQVYLARADNLPLLSYASCFLTGHIFCSNNIWF